MTVMQKLAVGALVAMGVAGLAGVGTAQAGPVPAAGVRAEGWASPGCVPVSVVKYSDGSVWGVENCGGLYSLARLKEHTLITKIQVIAEVSDADSDSRFLRLAEDVPAPPTLANLAHKFGVGGGDMEIELFDGFGMKQRISLAPFAGLDPHTYIRIRFLSAPADREFPDLEPGAVLLKEYLVAGPDD